MPLSEEGDEVNACSSDIVSQMCEASTPGKWPIPLKKWTRALRFATRRTRDKRIGGIMTTAVWTYRSFTGPLTRGCITVSCALALSACAAEAGKYPSLAIRDAERVSGQFTPSPPSSPLPAEPVASPSDLSAILERAYGLQRQFDTAEPGAQVFVRAAQVDGALDGARSRALVAVAELTSLRGQTALILSDLDQLEIEASTRFAPTETIRAAQADVATIISAQDAAIDALGEELQ